MMKALLTAAALLLFVGTFPAAAQFTCASSNQPASAQARADIAALGYTQRVFCDDFTSLSTIDLLENAPPYHTGYNWYLVPGSAWKAGGTTSSVADCTAQKNAGTRWRVWCLGVAQNLTGFATLTGGKVSLQANTDNSGFTGGGGGGSSADYPMLFGCAPTTTPPYFIGGLPAGGFYIETKFATGSFLSVIWSWNANYFVAGDGYPSQMVEIDNSDTGGNGRGVVPWWTTGTTPMQSVSTVLESPQDTITTSLAMGILVVPKADNTGQSVPGNAGANSSLLNWYNTSGYVSSNYGNSAGWPSGDNWVEQLAGAGSYPHHVCNLITGYPSQGPVILDYMQVWMKPQGSGGGGTSGAGFRFFGKR